jgi:hypothetical protein
MILMGNRNKMISSAQKRHQKVKPHQREERVMDRLGNDPEASVGLFTNGNQARSLHEVIFRRAWPEKVKR